MTAEQKRKRVAIAQDVIDQLVAGRYTAFNGYVSSERVPAEIPDAKRCGVCAVGGLWVSKLRLFNEAPDFCCFSNGDWREQELGEAFPDHYGIESALESWLCYDDTPNSYMAEYSNRRDRMLAIMYDIVAGKMFA